MRVQRAVLMAAGVAALTVSACASGAGDQDLGQLRQGVTVSEVDGNPVCPEGFFEYKIDPPVAGATKTYALDGLNSVTVTTTADNLYFDWSATLGVDLVIAKGGPNARLYAYSPEATDDSGLHAPINPNNGSPYGLSHISFCYDYEVMVSKTATTALTRSWAWAIDKWADEESLLLSAGQHYLAGYHVKVWPTGSTDSEWAMAGTISITNPAPAAAVITGVTDQADGVAATVDCGVSFPYELAPGTTLECSYTAPLPDGSSRTNVASVATEGPVGPGSGEAPVDFAGATVNGTDECVAVTDSLQGDLGTVCADEGVTTFSYDYALGPYDACGEYQVDNVASFAATDTGAAGSASWSIAISVPCVGGCTLTPGYWKTHSAYGPAPYDDTWAQLSGGADTAFFLSGQSFYQVLWTAPKGNAYYILAHAYIAAALNQLNGADFGAAQSAFDQATQLFLVSSPADRLTKTQRGAFINLAGILDAYNNGLSGPGHCSE
jgi:hypothetical protein